jgi:NADH-quinone oxidoreductase subunit L
MPQVFDHIHESPKVMTVPLMVLAALSFWIWFGANPIDPANGWFMKSWVPTVAQVVPASTAPHFEHHDDAHAAPAAEHAAPAAEQHAPLMEHQEILEHKTHEVATTGMLISITVALLGIGLAYLMYMKRRDLPDKVANSVKPLYKFSFNKWYFDELYEFAVVGSFLAFSHACAWFDATIVDGIVNGVGKVTVVFSRIGGWIDKYIVDGLVNFIAGVTQIIGLFFRSFQTGKVQTYLTWTLTIVLFVVIFWGIF